MPTVDLPGGPLHYREHGPADSADPPVVFVHGFLVNGSLWDRTARALAASGVRSYAPDLPLGSHRIALDADADQSPRGVARRVIAFLEALDLHDVTLVGNDSGGAISQFVLDTDASRIGRLVLTNCDAFDAFPPAPFDTMFKPFRRAGLIPALMAPTRSTAIRHSALGFGLLVTEPLDPGQTRDWVEPLLRDAGVRRDTARFVREVDPQELDGVTRRLGAFPGPALLVWGDADRFFKLDFARRLRDTLRELVDRPSPETHAAARAAWSG